jgi:hypothetical protein
VVKDERGLVGKPGVLLIALRYAAKSMSDALTALADSKAHPRQIEVGKTKRPDLSQVFSSGHYLQLKSDERAKNGQFCWADSVGLELCCPYFGRYRIFL